jgi:hypothetical protein
MIDATRSPQPAWRRYGTFILLGALIVFAAFFIWTKELHHHSSAAGSVNTPPAAAAPAAAAAPSVGKAPPTSAPGGIPVSSRNPFQG